MSIKRLIALSYLSVMLLPLVSLYLLYHLIVSYNAGTDFMDFMGTNYTIRSLEQSVQSPSLYQPPYDEEPALPKELRQTSHILLYNSEGTLIYNSNKDLLFLDESRQELYRNLYTIVPGYRAYTLKKPVFDENKLVGFYRISVLRSRFTRGINHRITIVGGIMAVILTLLFLFVMRLINTRLNRPLKLLIHEISMFAQGKDVSIINPSINDEVGELVKHFKSMKREIITSKEEIHKQQKEKEYLISAISHDLKTPLTSISAYTEALKQDYTMDSGKAMDYTGIILNKTEHMTKMIDDLLTYSLLTRDYNLNLVEVEGQEFFEMLTSGYDEVCKSKNIQLQVHCEIDGVFMLDVKNILRVMDNIVSNAIRYTPAHKHIGIAALSSGHPLPTWVCKDLLRDLASFFDRYSSVLLVQNEGDGLCREELERLFDPLYKCDPSRRDDKSGTGLGLTIAKSIVEKHGGSIGALSNGTTHTMVLFCLNKIN